MIYSSGRIFIYSFVFVSLLFGSELCAQLPLVRMDNIPVTTISGTLRFPWAGGHNSPQFSEIDLNGDGIKDLFVFEKNYEGTVKTYINSGSAGTVDYDYAPQYSAKFPHLRNWALLADYNCDGKEDIFTSVPAGIAVYRNDSDPVNGLVFTKVESLLPTHVGTQIFNLYVSSVDLPAIVDVDNDGDLDVLTFWLGGSSVEYHQNQSMDKYGHCDSLDFERVDVCWGEFAENTLNNGIMLGVSCRPVNSVLVDDPLQSPRHGGSTLLSFDADGDNDKDLVLGDLTYNNMVFLNNGGNTTNALITSVDTMFPSNTVPVNLTLFPAAFNIDVDNDNLKDLIVAPNNYINSENINNVWRYENTGNSAIPVFTFAQNNFLQEDMIDLGTAANPSFLDYDSDGLMDLVVGNYGYFVSLGTFLSKFSLFKNNGTASNPSFDLITDDFAGLSTLNLLAMKASFGDLDSDGDQDMIIGDADGEIHLFTNTAGAGNTVNYLLTQPNFKSIDVGQNAKPQIVDINKDGKLDLLIGDRSGIIKYYENIGTPTVPDFSSTATNGMFGGIDVTPQCCTGFSSPFMMVDSNGTSKLYVGAEYRKLYMYDNIDGNLGGTFNLVDSLVINGLNISIDGVDINNDNSPEIVYGELAGGLAILKHDATIGFNDIQNDIFDILLYPNPGNDAITLVSGGTKVFEKNKIQIFDLLGRSVPVIIETISGSKANINTQDLSPGMYIVTVNLAHHSISKKFIIKH